jgi:hypothetical protein
MPQDTGVHGLLSSEAEVEWMSHHAVVRGDTLLPPGCHWNRPRETFTDS